MDRPGFQVLCQRASAILVLGLGIVACANQQPAPAPIPTIPVGPVAVDGVYQGYATLVEADNSEEMLCGTSIALELPVTDRTFTYVLNEPQVTYAPVKRFLVQISADGGFTSQSGAANLRGQVAGKAMTGDVFGEACRFHFDTARP